MLRELITWWINYNDWVNNYCRDVAAQRDREYIEFQTWKNIVRTE